MKLRTTVLTLATLVALSLASSLRAEWSGGVEGGTVLRDDETATQLRFNLFNNERPLTHHLYIDWIRSNEKNDSYKAAYLPRYWFSNALYAFSEIHYRVDKPLAIDQQTQGILGAGYKFISTETNALWAELGAGVRSTEFESQLATNGQLERRDNFVLGRGGYRQVIATLFKFELDLEVSQSDDLREDSADAAISVRLGEGSLKYGYRRSQFKQDGFPTRSNADSYVSFSYGF